jgi:xanthine dehydrogenase large subunit
MLAMSVFFAIRDAIAACGSGSPRLDAPATPERILAAVDALRAASADARPG